MIFLFTALYCEAQIFIKHFHLEKNLENTQFQEFYSEAAGVRLTITGVGEIAAAAAVGGICMKYRPKPEDILLNVGICANTAGNEGVFLCNKITELATGKTFYPDILYRHNFKEEAVTTGMVVWNREEKCGEAAKTCVEAGETVSADVLYDMEAVAIYQAGAYFFGPHQMIFLKIVSDKGAENAPPKKQAELLKVDELLETYKDDLVNWVEYLIGIADRSRRQEGRPNSEGGLQQEKESLIEKLCADLHCSKTMRDSLNQHIHYMELSGTDYISVIRKMYREGLLPCKDKREGKLRFEELKKRLF